MKVKMSVKKVSFEITEVKENGEEQLLQRLELPPIEYEYDSEKPKKKRLPKPKVTSG